jgi:hypothetical protein
MSVADAGKQHKTDRPELAYSISNASANMSCAPVQQSHRGCLRCTPYQVIRKPSELFFFLRTALRASLKACRTAQLSEH